MTSHTKVHQTLTLTRYAADSNSLQPSEIVGSAWIGKDHPKDKKRLCSESIYFSLKAHIKKLLEDKKV